VYDNMSIINRFLKELFIFMNRIKRVIISNFGTALEGIIRFVEKFKFFGIYLNGKGNWLKVWNFYGYLYFLLWRCYASLS
jgi:hypothetical protein